MGLETVAVGTKKELPQNSKVERQFLIHLQKTGNYM